MKKIVADSHIPFVEDYFGSAGKLILKPGRSISKAEIKDADILLVRSITSVNKELLDGSSVQFVGSVTAGADHLDTEWLDKAGIKWSIAAGFNAPPVADYVVSIIAALQKKRIIDKKNIKAAIVGVGNVGRLVAERFRALNIEPILCDPIRATNEADFRSVPFESLADLDLISLHVPLTTGNYWPTHHFINKNFLKRQKPGCVLLNASRGGVIDSQDLLAFGKHLYWCFDVWEHEPNINKQILEQALIATPHIAGYSVQSRIRGIDMIYRIACENSMLKEKSMPPFIVPKQELAYAGDMHTWQDIVLGVFNPLIISSMMKTILLPAKDEGHLFDDMRNEFNYRHEFKFTTIIDSVIAEKERSLLEQLSLQIKP